MSDKPWRESEAEERQRAARPYRSGYVDIVRLPYTRVRTRHHENGHYYDNQICWCGALCVRGAEHHFAAVN